MMQNQIQNSHWCLAIAVDRPLVTALMFDTAGRGQWCANLLKTGASREKKHPITTVCGAQSGYFDSANAMHLSSSCRAHAVDSFSDTEIVINHILYGNVREQWQISLHDDKLTWGIEPRFDGISVQPALPASACPATVKLLHLGKERSIEIGSPTSSKILIAPKQLSEKQSI